MRVWLSAVAFLATAGALLLCFLLIREPWDRYTVVSTRLNHTYLHTHDEQTFVIDVLTSPEETHHFAVSAIVAVEIRCPHGETRFPLRLVDVEHGGHVVFNHEAYVSRRIRLQPRVILENHRHLIDEAMLRIEYHDHPPLEIDIGAFGYAFHDKDNTHLFVHAIYNVHGVLRDIPTSTGVIIGIKNTSDVRLSIENVVLNAAGVVVDFANVRRYEGPLHAHLCIEDVLDERFEIVGIPENDATPFDLDVGDDVFLIVPFKYIDEHQLLHRYPLLIEYVPEGDGVHIHSEDDVPYIRTGLYHVGGSHHVIIHPD